MSELRPLAAVRDENWGCWYLWPRRAERMGTMNKFLGTRGSRMSLVQRVEILNGVRDPRTPKSTLVSLRVVSLG